MEILMIEGNPFWVEPNGLTKHVEDLSSQLVKQYGDSVTVLSAADFDDQEKIHIIWKNGVRYFLMNRTIGKHLLNDFPTSGNICINGLDPYKHRIQSTKNIGVVFGQRTQLWWDIPIRESFSMLKEIYEIPNSVYDANIKYFGEILGVSEFMGYPARKLSLGQRMRADIVASLIHNPPVIYLDEPTIGLDVAVKERVCEFLKKINKERGTTILLTSHDLDDIEKVCSRIIVIDHGKKLFDGDAALLKRKYAYNRCIVVKTAYDLPKENKICNELPNITVEKTDSHVYEISFNQDEYSAYNIIQKLSEYLPIVDFSLREPSVEQVVKKIYNGEIEREFEV